MRLPIPLMTTAPFRYQYWRAIVGRLVNKILSCESALFITTPFDSLGLGDTLDSGQFGMACDQRLTLVVITTSFALITVCLLQSNVIAAVCDQWSQFTLLIIPPCVRSYSSFSIIPNLELEFPKEGEQPQPRGYAYS